MHAQKTFSSSRLFPLLALLLLVVSIAIPLSTTRSSALSGSQFKAGDIIDDNVFYDAGSLSASGIQSFLNSKLPTCDTNGTTQKTYYYKSSSGEVSTGSFSGASQVTTSRAIYGSRYDKYHKTTIAAAPYTCLKSYKQNTTVENSQPGICSGLSAKTGRTAAQIISEVSTACGVSPKVLIVLLQKEQGLVTDDWPWDNEYQKATGFGCPDTSGCDSAYNGFFNQVYHAARQFRLYRANPDDYNYTVGSGNTILYHYPQCMDKSGTGITCKAGLPTSGSGSINCGVDNLTIINQATAGLYDYTPYVPNKAALDNLNGDGDRCSAYGNRNFWVYYNEWFGSTHVTYVKMETPRWMQLTQDTIKLDTFTQQPTGGSLSAGQQVFFEDKITIDGVDYLRTLYDSQHGWNKVVPLSLLQDIPATYTPLGEPAYMRAKTSLHKVNPVTGQNVGGVVKKGQDIYFTDSITINGVQYLRSQYDSSQGWSRAIPQTSLSEVTYTPMEFPRHMRAKSNLHKVDPETGQNVGGVVKKGQDIYFTDSITINGVQYLRSQYDSSQGWSRAIPRTRLSEVK